MIKHYVTFYSPGTFLSEETTKEIDSWDIDKAKEMARTIKERYGATPYCFKFTTLERGSEDFYPKQIARSKGCYYLGGQIISAEEILAGDDPKEEILRINIRCNDIKKIIINDNSWRFTGEFKDDDVLLEFP